MSIRALAGDERAQWAETTTYWHHAQEGWTDSVANHFEEFYWTRVEATSHGIAMSLDELAQLIERVHLEVP